MLVFIKLDSQVQTRHCKKLERVLFDVMITRCKKSVEMIHGDTDDFSVQVEVINDCGFHKRRDAIE